MTIKHLNDQNLTELLYQECPDSRAKEWTEHLSNCETCSNRRDELSTAMRLLDQLVVEPRVPSLNETAERRAHRDADLPRHRSVPWLAIAASLLLMVAAAGFWAGAKYSSNRFDLAEFKNGISDQLQVVKAQNTKELQSAMERLSRQFDRSNA